MSDGPNCDTFHVPVPQICCKSCSSPLVQATDWKQEDESHWRLRLWCPECDFEQEAILDRPQVIYLSLAVEEGFACVLEALAGLETLADTGLVTPSRAELELMKRNRSERIEPTSF